MKSGVLPCSPPSCSCKDCVLPPINVICSYRAAAWLLPADRREIARLLALMLIHCPMARDGISTLELNLVDDAEMARVNAANLGLQGPTNIISFPGSGILVLSLDTYRRECLLYGQSPGEHLIRLLAHGLGHLAGHEHGPQMDAFCLECETAALNAESW